VPGLSVAPCPFPLCFADLTFPNDVIRREHSPPGGCRATPTKPAMMIDTFRPLKLAAEAQALDDPQYPYS
jgi:hypothetical protein